MTHSDLVQQLQIMIEAERPEKSDAIIWLHGDQYDRGAKVLELFQEGYAPKIFLTGNNVLVGSGARPGEDNITMGEMLAWLLARNVPETAILVDDQSMNTHDQAVAMIAQAQIRGWRRILLVGSRHHQLRPFLTFLKQADREGWQGAIINQPATIDEGWENVPSGRDKTAGEIFKNEVRKLALYNDHVASVEEGIAYLHDAAHRMSFRPATKQDSDLLFSWRNDPTAYRHFLQPKPVAMDEHAAWLEAVIADPDRFLLIVEDLEHTPIGQVRFDAKGDAAEISITLSQAVRGKGYGTASIRRVSRQFLREHSRVHTIIAEIKEANTPSLAAFTKAGYREINRLNGAVRLAFALPQQP